MIDVPYEVKKALRDGTYRKNYRFIVLHDDWTEDFTIANDNLIKESVSIDERMCSGDTIKYGLCEGSSLEFQYFEKPNITGRRVQAFVDVDYKKVITQYSWETQEQFSTAFTVTDMSGDCRLYTELDSAWDFVYVTENGTTTQVYPTATESGTIIELGDVTGRTLIVALPVIPAPTADLQLLVPHVGPAILTHPIPLGFFDVKKCSRQASTGIIKVTAYNKLQSDYFDSKANQVLEDLFTEDYNLKVFDIETALLNTHKIDETPRDRVFAPDLFPDLNTASTIGFFHLTKDYGVDTFLNSYVLSSLAGTGFYLSVIHYNDEYRGDITRIDASFGSLLGLEQNFYNYLKEVIDGAELDLTANEVMNALLSDGHSYCNLFPISYGTTDYSTIQWQYNQDHGIVNDRVKPLQDAWRIRNHYQLSIPLGIGVTASPIDEDLNPEPSDCTAFLDFNGKCIYDGNTHLQGDYKYYADAQHNLATGYCPHIVFSDGHIYAREDGVNIYGLFRYDLPPAEDVSIKISEMPDFTIRDLQTAVFETQCQFGQLSRTTDLFAGVELGHSRLLPAETLYPATDLYPGGARLSGSKAMYSKLWADEGNIHKWRYLIITYKGLDDEGNEQDYTLQRTVNNDGTDNYNCSDNWLFRNLVWTAEQIGEYADAMVAKMQGITWFPFEMWCAGLPYLETGDEIEIPLGDQKYVSYVLQRQLKGIQNLQDTYINGTLDIY